MDCFSRHRRLVSGLTHEAVSRAIEMWCLHCSPCIFARPRGWAYKRLCPSVCPRFFFPAIQTSTSGGWRGLERWFGGRRSSPCIFFTIVFTWEWMRRQDFCLAHFGGCGVWMWKYVRFGGFSPVFFVLVQCTQHKGICEYQKNCNCNNFLGEMVHYLTEVQRRQDFWQWLYTTNWMQWAVTGILIVFSIGIRSWVWQP